jgi:acid phosphatase type 7
MPLVPGPRLPIRTRRFPRRLVVALALLMCASANAAGSTGTPKLAAQATSSTRTLPAVADAVTRADAPATKTGTGKSLRVDGAPVVRSFLRFDLATVSTIQRATLRIHVETPNRVGLSIRNTTGNWSEQGVTHANAPAVGAVVGSSGRIAAGQEVDVDVTSLARPGGTLNLAVTTSSTTNTRFTSREGGPNGPRLVLVTGTDAGSWGGGGTEEATGTDEPPPAGGTVDWQPTAPIRAAFYYPWFPQAWRQQGKDPFAVDQPSAGYYDSSSPETIAGHIDAMRHGGIQAGISSWWGRGTPTDLRLPRLLEGAAGKPFRWSVYHEGEGQGDPSVTELTADLTYLSDRYGKDPSYLRIDGRFVVFVYGDAETCDTVNRWRQANTVGAYVILKVFSGHRNCPAHPDGWHQYGPAVASSSHLPYSVTVSPGFHKATEPAPRLARDLGRWQRDVEAMAASKAQFHLITTFNEWGEGTAVESSTSWSSSSGYGQYLDVLHRVVAATPSSGADATQFSSGSGDPVIAAVGDIACDPGDSNFKSGAGGRSSCHQAAVSDLLVNRNLAAFLPLGDNQYEDGTLAKFNASYEPSFGRLKAITRPVVGNHEYLTPGAAGYFDYFGSQAGVRGQGWYSYDIGGWHLIALNSTCGKVGGCGPDSPQGRWLKADLATHPTSCTLAYWHHPRFSSGKHGSTIDMAPLWQALYDAGAEIVLSGHDHVYERFAPQDAAGIADPARGIRQFIVGTGGKNHYAFTNPSGIANSEARDAATYGVLELTLGANTYTWRFVPPSGGVFTDSGSGTCH